MYLNAEHEAFREAVALMASKEVTPIATQVDREDHVPEGIFRSFATMGLIQLAVPTEYGGPGADVRSECIAREEVAVAGSMALATLAAQNSNVVRALLATGSQGLREQVLPDLAQGGLLCCIAMTEPSVGSAAGSVTTRANRRGDMWRLTGRKAFISHGDLARYALVFARTGRQSGTHGVSAFIVDTRWDGWIVERHNEKMGQKGLSNCDIRLDNIAVPESHLLGDLNGGFPAVRTSLAQNRLSLAALALGGARASYDYALRYALDRKLGGRSIFDHQGMSWRFADIAASIEAAECLIARAAWIFDTGADDMVACQLASMAKLVAADLAVTCANHAMQTLGGCGYMRDHPVERYLRDARVLTIYEGTSEIQRNLIARGIASRMNLVSCASP